MHGNAPKPSFITDFDVPEPIKKFIERISTEHKVELTQISPRRFAVVEQEQDSHYKKYKMKIRIDADGIVDCGDDEAYAPNEAEAEAIKAVADKLPKSILASEWMFKERLLTSGRTIGKVIPIYDSKREHIITAEERVDPPNGKKNY